MSFDHLWAGWRSQYVESVTEPGAAVLAAPDDTSPASPEDATSLPVDLGGPEYCVFCQLLASGAPDVERNLVFESAHAAVLLNAYPYAPGHLLAMPRRHVADLSDLDPNESLELWEAVRASVAAIQRAYAPNGMNFGANLGRAAGAGIPRHVHVHILPRWIGDTNFMTTVAATRVLPEALPDSWAKLRAAWTE